ncbi:MAG TPA: APC family permease [Solirubrobacteraceae bacterium]|jgi:amino acid transporter|nr:APC family permease [Solirubrobacteraceae bacterium]
MAAWSAAGLTRTVTWRSSIVVTLGAALLVTVSLGPMAQELGTVSPFIWLVAAAIGALQCLLLARLAASLFDRAGGTATYTHSAVGRSLPIFGAISSWSYWFAWTPGIAVNLILAATYLRETVWPSLGTLPFALVLGGVLYAVNGLGLKISMRVATVAAAAALIPLAAIFAGALVQPSLLHLSYLYPVAVPSHAWRSANTWGLLVKWLFITAWSAYGAEMASTIVAEMCDAESRAARALHVAGGVGLVSFGLLPFLMLALVGAHGLTEDPLVTFLPVAEAVFGSIGRTVVGVMLTAALILGAQAFIVGSSRTVYQMTRDGYMPRQFAFTTGRGVPVGSMLWDGTVIVVLLLIFGTNVVNVVAAANVGYLVVFVLMPLAFVVLERNSRGGAHILAARPMTWLALGLAIFNALLLIVGGIQWGGKVMFTGIVVIALIVPISAIRRAQDRYHGYTDLLPFPAGKPHDVVGDLLPTTLEG